MRDYEAQCSSIVFAFQAHNGNNAPPNKTIPEKPGYYTLYKEMYQSSLLCYKCVSIRCFFATLVEILIGD